MKATSRFPLQQEQTKQTMVPRHSRAFVLFIVFCSTLLLSLATTFGATRYVWQGSPGPAPPYTNWATAARVIQDAADAAQPGDTVLVAGGVYAMGGRAVGTNLLVNRVAIDRAITVESLMGPEVTIIQGYQVPGTTNGDDAIRCVYLADDATLSGFTLTNGATRNVDDYYTYHRESSGGGVWCESTNAVVSNCTLSGNSAHYHGGGAYGGTLNNCTLSGNSAQASGGGTAECLLSNCALTGNSASSRGGGAYDCTLSNCTLTGNSAVNGGGASDTTLNSCTLTGNSAVNGGGASDTTLHNCTLTGNSAEGGGGGVGGGTLNNCTLTGNSAGSTGGGASGATLNNCIVYFNTAAQGANYSGGTLNFCCTAPLPAAGSGNISADPQLASASHLSPTSPCRGAGNAAYTSGVDIDGEPWASPPSIGCDEYHAGGVTGPLQVAISVDHTNVAAGFALSFTARISGHPSASVWDFGDGAVASNRPYASHAWGAPGDYTVVLRAYNESYPAGVNATAAVHVVAQPVHYVVADSTNPLPPYTSWATAATNIQEAVDAATVSGALVLVSNGVYAGGLEVIKPLAVRGVSGPERTVVDGGGSVRCVYLASGASLAGFTLTNGVDRGLRFGGGGVRCESASVVVSNCVLADNWAGAGGGALGGTLDHCVLTGNHTYIGNGGGATFSTLNHCTLTANRASGPFPGGGLGGGAFSCTLNHCVLTSNSAYDGAGASGGTLNHCVLTGNSARDCGGGAAGSTLNNCVLTGNWVLGPFGSLGGGADSCTLNNCTLSGNWAEAGGGATDSTLNNCIVYFNTATNGANHLSCTLNFCCTTPLPTNGVGNITNAPLFVDTNGWSNLRLQSNSPCINGGNNASVTTSTDLDGHPRIIGGTVDMGAYENTDGATVNGVPWAWLLQYSLPTDGSADYADFDTDGHTTWQEWRCQTCPTNALSVLRLLPASSDGTNVTVTWQSVAGVTYFLERSTDLSASPPFTLLAPNLSGQPGTTAYSDTNATALTPLFYRVGVGN